MSEVLTVPEAADLLQLHPVTVRDYARAGLIPARKFGNVWRFSKDALINHLDNTESWESTETNEPGSIRLESTGAASEYGNLLGLGTDS